MRDVYVIGAYTSVFKKHPGLSFSDLAREAYLGGGVIGMEEAVASVVILQRG